MVTLFITLSPPFGSGIDDSDFENTHSDFEKKVNLF